MHFLKTCLTGVGVYDAGCVGNKDEIRVMRVKVAIESLTKHTDYDPY